MPFGSCSVSRPEALQHSIPTSASKVEIIIIVREECAMIALAEETLIAGASVDLR